ncbi:amino acid adenylation domain-containing protein [Streptomyces sp. NPDC051597]|uniref:amino acid adenylation domain-containing protein n=1 Tax=Streptomyces sp. NPDC051597 TaxID=3155049 RepID=UPI00342FADA0
MTTHPLLPPAPPPAPDPLTRAVHRLVEERAARTPDADAVLYGTERLSYARLDRQAEQLARRLRHHGVGPEVPVGVHLTRSPALAVACLAVLKAGGACVPLDPAHPPTRLAQAVRDAGAPLVLSRRALAPGLGPHPATVLYVDSEDTDPAARAEQRPPAPPEPGIRPPRDTAPRPPGDAGTPPHPSPARRLAWVAYTSGSTGRPKPVGLEHGPLANLAVRIGRRLDLGPEDRVLQFASPGFSVAAEEMFSTWAAGACLVMDPDDTLADSAGLLAAVDRYAVTVLQLTPTLWYEWLRELSRDGTLRPPASLRLLVVGSEQAAPDRAADWLATGVRLVHEYGATEGTVSQILYEPDVSPDELRTWPRLPIGTPLPGVRVHILDPEGRPVAPGESGELHLAGDTLARGYVGQPALTAERFLPDPFTDRPDARMYRTGDLARQRADGNLEFLGRVDHQITLRGVRIEPGEIETVIGRYPGVTESAVLARTTARGDDQLCACVVWHKERDEPGLRAHLRATLPPALVPARLTALPELPRTPHGKVDRYALRAMPWDGDRAASPDGTPRTALEAALAALWAWVLDVPSVGVDDSLFDRGGDSLTATRLAARLREVLGADVRQRTVFDAPTVRAMAEVIARLRRGTRADEAVGAADEGEEAPLSSAQWRMWLHHRRDPASAAYHEPVALRLRGPLDADHLVRALRRTVERHAALRTTIGTAAGQPVQRVAPPATAETFPLVGRDLSGSSASELEGALQELAVEPFDLRRGPLIRAHLLKVAADDHVLVLVLHHIVFDGWSMDVLFRDLTAFHDEAATGVPAALPTLPSQPPRPPRPPVGDPDAEHRTREQRAYWERQLEGAPPVTRLPVGRPTGRQGTVRCPFTVPAASAARLRELAAEEGATPFMVLLAAFTALVHRGSGTRDIVVGTLLAGRDSPDTTDLIGLFTHTVPLRTRVPEGTTFRDLVRRVRETVLGAVAAQDVPFEHIVAHLGPPRDARHNPVFQMVFCQGGASAPAPRLHGLGVTPVEVAVPCAKFDVTVMVEEDRHGGHTVDLAYDLALYDETTAHRHTAAFRALLETFADRPETVV